ncbi:I78 family peptidase inhibitor [Parvibaculum lavamentivorans]|nr:I78 family peptidase inhibitor [Parvibaculum lavamentivorans]
MTGRGLGGVILPVAMTMAFLSLAACHSGGQVARTAKPGAGAERAISERSCDSLAATHRARWHGEAYEKAQRDIVVMGEIERIRIIRPGDVVTMDYDPHRLNVTLDAASIVRDVECG